MLKFAFFLYTYLTIQVVELWAFICQIDLWIWYLETINLSLYNCAIFVIIFIFFCINFQMPAKKHGTKLFQCSSCEFIIFGNAESLMEYIWINYQWNLEPSSSEDKEFVALEYFYAFPASSISTEQDFGTKNHDFKSFWKAL